MAYDLQIIYPQALLPIAQVRAVPGMVPSTLSIEGGPFLDVEEVLINGIKSPSIVIPSSKQVLAEVPSSQEGGVTNVEVLSSSFFLSDRAVYRFRLGNQVRLVTGLPKLIQTYLRILLQRPGSSMLAPDLGGGLLDMVSSPHAPKEQRALTAQVYQAVQRTSEALLTYQSRLAGVPRTELLAGAQLLRCGFPGGRLSVELALQNQAGQGGQSFFDLLAYLHEDSSRCVRRIRRGHVQGDGPLPGSSGCGASLQAGGGDDLHGGGLL